MEYLLQIINSFWQNKELTHGAILVVAAVSATLIVLSIGLIIMGVTDPRRRRLNSIARVQGNTRVTQSSFQKMANSVKPISMPKKQNEMTQTQLRLMQAGYRSQSAMTTFYAIKLFFAIGLPGLLLFAAAAYPRFSGMQVAFAAILVAAIGLLLPSIFLEHQLKKRKKNILHGFPDALDLLVACTEAGLGLNSSLQRVADEMDISSPELAEELNLVNAEIRAGVDRVQAMNGLYERTGLEDIRGLVSMFSQTMRFGTSIADALRIYAEEFRDKRMQKAEEQAAKLGTKMIFPMVLCIFPSFFIVAIGPAVLRLIDVFRHMGGN